MSAQPSARAKRGTLAIWVGELGGDRDRNSITPAELDRVVQRWTVTPTIIAKGGKGAYGRPSDPDGLQAGTIRQRVKVLRAFFSTMNGAGGANPARGCKVPPEPKPEARGLDYATIARILDAMPTHRSGGGVSLSRVRAALIAYTGIAPKTIKRLTRADVGRDPSGAALHLRARKKGGGVEARTVPLTARGVEALQAFDAANAYGAFHTPTVNEAFKAAAARVGVARGSVRLYDLRHSFGTELYRQTRDLATVARMLQHSVGSPLTARYALNANDEVDRAAADGFLATPAPRVVTGKRAQSSHRKVPKRRKAS